MDEIYKYLGDDLKHHYRSITNTLVEGARMKSKYEGGVLHKRPLPLIKKKVANMKRKLRHLTENSFENKLTKM